MTGQSVLRTVIVAMALVGTTLASPALAEEAATVPAPAVPTASTDGIGDPKLYNDIDNNLSIDQIDELAEATNAPDTLSADELSRELSNPNSPLSSLTFKHIYTTYKGTLPGASDQSSSVTLFQPAFPFPLDGAGTTNLFIRPAFAYVWQQPVFDPNSGTFRNLSGFSDLGFDVAVGRSWDSGWTLVGGVQGTIPLYTDVSGRQWRLGPELLGGIVGKKAFLVGFPSHQWDVGGADYDYSLTKFELFAGAYLPNAWTVYTDSLFTYDWVNKQSTIPINLTVRKVTKIGNVPVSVALGADYFVKSNDAFGEDWRITLNLSPVVPNFFLDWIR